MTNKFPLNLNELDLQSMSKEELLSYIQLQSKEISKQAKELDKQSKTIDKQSAKINKQAEKLNKKDEQLAYLLTKDDAMQIFWDDMAEASRFISNYTLNIGECRIKPFIDQLEAIKNDYLSWIRRAGSWLGKPPFTVGNESLASKTSSNKENPDASNEDSNGSGNDKSDKSNEALDDTQKTKDKLAEQVRSFSNNKARIGSLMDVCRTVVQTSLSIKKELTDTEKALQNIANTSEIIDEERKKQELEEKASKNKGRQKADRPNPIKKLKVTQSDAKCSKCDSSDLVNLKDEKGNAITTLQNMLVDINRIKDNLEHTEITQDVWYCNKCGHIHISRDNNTPHPIIPRHQMDSVTIFRAVECQYHGIPVSRFKDGLCEKFHIGNNTIEREIKNFTQIYLKPLYVEIMNAMNDCSVIMCDGTPFNALESQGRGSVVACKAKANATNKDASDINETCSSNYILAVTTGPAEKKQAVIYHYIKNRTIDNITKALKNYEGCEYLCTDAYTGYNSVAANLGDDGCVKVQKCLVHARRELLKAVLPDNVAKEFDNLTRKEQLEYLTYRMNASDNSDSFVIGLSVMDAISLIYHHESMIDYRDQSPRGQEKIRSIRKKQKVLMENIDVLVHEMAREKVTEDKTGKFGTKNRNDPYAKFCVYYLNNRKDLCAFTESTVIPPDTNIVERIIRPLTILRKNIFHKNAEWGMECMTIIYSVFKTLEMNGYDVEDFIKKYVDDLYYHCYEKRVGEAYKEGVDLATKQIIDWDMERLSKDFDFSKYNPLKIK